MLGEDLEDPEEYWRSCSRLGIGCWQCAPSPPTAVRPTGGWDGKCAFLPDSAPPLFTDIADQFGVVTIMADGQREFLHGVIEFYQTRTSTHMTMAAEKTASTGVRQNEEMRRITAWVAIVAVPTAVTGSSVRMCRTPGSGPRPASSPQC